MAPLKSQVVLVTGCSTGIGRALARELKIAGHRPLATARKLDAIADLAGEGIETLRLDVNDPGSIAAAVDAAIERAGRIDVLVNNAGINFFGPLMEMKLDEVRAVFETNVIGLLAVTQAVFPRMAQQRSGRIVNVGSVVGVLPTPFAAAYCATKSAVHMLSEVLRMEAKPFGVDVVVVQPGGVQSNIADSGSRDLERFHSPDSRYHPAYEGIRKRAYASQKGATPTADFARDVVRLSLANPAPRVVRLGTGADTLPKLARMPGKVRDRILSTRYELDKIS
ncbi:MAG TPA: SDR family NAD(P)-dependent oxidoreductase [Polyangiaceae bacterium]|nr:SDR family NAD(P)-dependent oxidoreductase [Polyangiaceae bacterium]